MNIIIIAVLSISIYYIGLSYLAYKAFQKKNITIGYKLAIVIPGFIIKSYAAIVWKYKTNSVMRRHAMKELVFGYGTALAIFVEVVSYAVDKGMIPVGKKKSIKEKVRYLFRNVKTPYNDNLNATFA